MIFTLLERTPFSFRPLGSNPKVNPKELSVESFRYSRTAGSLGAPLSYTRVEVFSYTLHSDGYSSMSSLRQLPTTVNPQKKFPGKTQRAKPELPWRPIHDAGEGIQKGGDAMRSVSKEELSPMLQECRRTGRAVKVLVAKYQRQSMKDTHPQCLYWEIQLPSGETVMVPGGLLDPVCKKDRKGIARDLVRQAKASRIYWDGLIKNWVCVGKEA